jgi:hypothetical protein
MGTTVAAGKQPAARTLVNHGLGDRDVAEAYLH